jgi:hypothetical protein
MRAWLVALAAACALAACGESIITVYPTHSDAVADGAIVRGWVPEFVPPDATDIREVHSVDDPFVALSFRAPRPTGGWGFRPVEAAHRGEALKALRSVRFASSRPGRRASVAYRCEPDGVGLLAHDPRTGRFYYAGPFESASFRGLCTAGRRMGSLGQDQDGSRRSPG